MYPTGQPFWLSAGQMRQELRQVRHDVDPNSESDAFNQMVLVGHSMGGLVSKMQTIDSNDEFWSIISKRDIGSLNASDEIKSHLRDVFYFEKNPGISRLITIATPHRGSRYANNATRWLSHKILAVPQILETTYAELVQNNKSMMKNTKHLMIPTSIDSLAPDSPFIAQLLDSETKVKQHNIIGNISKTSWSGTEKATGGDGIVSTMNASLENIESQILVNEEHQNVHQHPQTILEVRRILIENLVELGRIDDREQWAVPATFQSATGSSESDLKK